MRRFAVLTPGPSQNVPSSVQLVSACRGLALGSLLLAAVACSATREEAPQLAPTAPDVARITCGVDGSTIVDAPQVLVQADGVHFDVGNELDKHVGVIAENASMGFRVGLGLGSTVRTDVAPQDLQVGCLLPPSQDEPKTTASLQILDPTGMYTSWDVQCPPGVGSSSMVADFFTAPVDPGPPPLDEARTIITGLQVDDLLAYTGYRDAPHQGVAVIRGGRVIATFGFARFADSNGWVQEDRSSCSDSGLSASH